MAEQKNMTTAGTTQELRDPSAYKFNVDYQRFSSFLGVQVLERGNKRLAEKTATIYDWARLSSKSEEIEKIYNRVKDLIKELGSQNKGKELVGQLHRWIRLDMDGLRAKEWEKKKASEIKQEAEQLETKRLEAKEKRNKFIDKQERTKLRSQEIKEQATLEAEQALKGHRERTKPIKAEPVKDVTPGKEYFEAVSVE